jgi:hypothetical protein
MGEHAKSNDFLNKATQSRPDDPRIVYGLHMVMQAKNIVMINPAHGPQAIDRLNKAIECAQGNDSAMNTAVMTKCALAPEKLGISLKRIREISAELERNADPSLLWEMCRLMQSSVPRETERRILLKQLMEVFPKFEPVENGDCLAEYADSCFRFCDYVLAKETYEKLKKEFPRHAVAVSRDHSGAGERIKECEYWLEKLK